MAELRAYETTMAKADPRNRAVPEVEEATIQTKLNELEDELNTMERILNEVLPNDRIEPVKESGDPGVRDTLRRCLHTTMQLRQHSARMASVIGTL